MQIEIIKGDITRIKVDAIVNAANTSLLGGGGVDGAIHRKGGSLLLEECQEIRNRQGGCKVGHSVITNACNLPSNKLIHTVGPKWNEGNSSEDKKLESCYLSSLQIAEENNLKSIAYPSISTGIYRFPKKRAAKIAIQAVKKWNSDIIEKVIFVCYDKENYNIYKELIEGND